MQNNELNIFQNCPLCNNLLVDDYWETILEDEKGNFVFDVFDAWVCQNRCGYYVRKKEDSTMDKTILEVEQKLENLKTIYSFIKNENKTVNKSIFTILGKGFHENTISDYLAYILDPKLNGIGTSPIQYVLNLLHCGLELKDNDLIEIDREYTLLNNRRIDFLININRETIIAIEHKVFSEEHGDQTKDYAKLIEREFANSGYKIFFIFLTPTGKTPLSNQFIPITYEQLVSALRKVKVDYIKDIRKAILFNEFIFHLEGQFMKNQTIALSNKSMLFLDNFHLIDDLQNEFVSDYQNIFKYIESIIESYYLNEIGGNWEFDFKQDRGYHKIFKQNWKGNGIDIHFELRLDINSLVSQNIKYMLDIEGSKKKLFDLKYDHLLKQHLNTKDEIKYRSNNRRDTFAHKSYHMLTKDLLKDEALFRKRIIQMIKDFSFLIEPIDKAILEFSQN